MAPRYDGCVTGSATLLPTHNSLRDDARDWLLLGGVLLAVLVVRVAGLALSNAEFYLDEAQYWAWAQEPAFGYFTKPPLIAWLIAGSTAWCGDSPFCVRLPSPFLHLVTAIVVYLVALRLFDRRTALVAAVVYNLLPGMSLSATLMSTDAPLLLFWSLGLLAIVHHLEKPSVMAGLALGAAVGLGLNAKYAMAFLPACFLLYGLWTPSARKALLHPGTALALVVAAMFIAPNIVWNAQHGFATFEHTRDDAGWGGRFPNLTGMAEFVGAQIAIIGPVPFAAFMLCALGMTMAVPNGPRRLLLFHSLPVFLLFIAQALVAKANGNWAATGFPAATILAVAAMLSLRWRKGLAATFAIAIPVFLALSFAGTAVGTVTEGPAGREFAKLSGARTLGDDIAALAEAQGLDTVVFTQRSMTASMIYVLRESRLDVRAWLDDGVPPADHFELTRPWRGAESGPALLVTMGDDPPPARISGRATRVGRVETRSALARSNGGFVTAWRVQ